MSKKKKPTIKTRNSEVLSSFNRYRLEHPNERFYQALRNWSGFAFIYVSKDPDGEGEVFDTFYFSGRNK